MININILIEEDITKLFENKSRCSVEKLVTYSPMQSLDERPTEIVNFFEGCVQKIPERGTMFFFIIAKLIKKSLWLTKVLPLSFRHNLVSYSLFKCFSLGLMEPMAVITTNFGKF